MSFSVILTLMCDGCGASKDIDLRKNFVADGTVINPMEHDLGDVIRWVAPRHDFYVIRESPSTVIYLDKKCVDKALNK